MWQRFTETARKVIFCSQNEAAKLGEKYVSTEHILLGLTCVEESSAARILERLQIPLRIVRNQVEAQAARGDGRIGQDFQLTPRAKRAIDLAYDEARQLGVNYIGTEHLLLGVVREGNGLGSKVLAALGADLECIRGAVQELHASGQSHESQVTLPTEKLPVHRSANMPPLKSATDLLTELLAGQKRLEEKLDMLMKQERRRKGEKPDGEE